MQPTDQHERFLRAGRMLTNLARLGGKLDLPDHLQLPGNRPVLMVANHRSLLDLAAAMAIFTKFGLSCRILIRQDLVESGLSGRFLRGIGCIPASRHNRRQAEEAAIDALQRGHIVALMPEGRLVKPEEWVDGVGPGRKGVSRIAIATDAVVVPVGITGSNEVWPRGGSPRIRLRRPTVTVRVGEPIEMESTDHQVNADRVMKAISELLV